MFISGIIFLQKKTPWGEAHGVLKRKLNNSGGLHLLIKIATERINKRDPLARYISQPRYHSYHYIKKS
jgi:hypothetical protein